MSGKILHLPQRITTLTRERPVAPLVGRDTELAALHQRLVLALQGQRQIVFIAGEPGIGKTALVDAFLRQLQERLEIHTTSGQCVEQYGPGEAYLPLLEATTRLCRAQGGERYIEMLQRYAPSWLAQLSSLLEPQEFARLQQRVQGTSRERMLREMAEAAELLTTTRTLVLALEDLHWSDVSTLDWVTYIARRREPAKLLILGTYRPADALASNHPLRGIVQELQARSQCEELRLAPLAEEAIVEYLIARSAEEATDRSSLQKLTPVLYRRTGGNPLFLVNMVDDLIRQGFLVEEAGQQTLITNAVKAVSESIPNTLRQLIERQLERLPESEQQLLKVASVAGVEFAAAEAAAGLIAEQDSIEETCERLARTGQWLRATEVAEWPDGTVSGRYSFLHAVYHEVVYAQVTEVHRVQLHRRIAERKEAGYGERVGEIAAELAMHFEAGREYQRAIEYLTRAGENALQRSAHAEAIRHLTTALSLLTTLPDSPQRVQQELRVQATLGAPLVATRGYAAPEVEATYLRASALCQQAPDTPYLFPSLWGLWAVYAVRPDHQKALELGERLLDLTQQRNDAGALVQAHWAVGQPLLYMGRFSQAREHFEQGWALYALQRHGQNQASVARAGQDPGVNCLGLTARILWALGYPDQALQKSQEALTLAQELQHPLSVGFALAIMTMIYQLRQEASKVQEKAEAAIALCREYGFAFYLALENIRRGWALAEQGQPEEGIAQLQQGLAALRATGAEFSLSHYLAALAEAYEKAGQIDKGLIALSEGLALAEKHEERFDEAELYRLKGELTLQQTGSRLQAVGLREKKEEVEGYFLKAIDIARKQQAKSLELRATMSLARLWQSQGKQPAARKTLASIYSWFTEGFDTKDLQEAAALLTALGGTVRRTADHRPQTGENRGQGSVNGERAEGAEQEVEREPAILEIQGSQLQVQGPHPTPNPQPPIPNSQFPIPDAQDSGLNPQESSLFRYEGDFWTVSFAGLTCRLKAARGLHYIAHLLQHPHQEFHVIALTNARADLSEETTETHFFPDQSLASEHTKELSEATAILTPQARAAYKQRLAELREELTEAQRFHDLGQVEKLQAELDVLTHKLARTVGLGGRAQRAGSPTERARVNITRAIKSASRKIAEHHPVLGQHLATTIKTGVYCSYIPDTRLPITWQS